ncbi:MAG: sodium ion-translocating decarboxylase subunit beta, partial [Bacteroidales bacterium]|nr:sodium ion-translocating decarboxylase subunit beta [Bacteroidales bacterium]
MEFIEFFKFGVSQFLGYTGFANVTWGHICMIAVGIFFIALAVKKNYEPLLLIPIGFGMIIGNIPFVGGLE